MKYLPLEFSNNTKNLQNLKLANNIFLRRMTEEYQNNISLISNFQG